MSPQVVGSDISAYRHLVTRDAPTAATLTGIQTKPQHGPRPRPPAWLVAPLTLVLLAACAPTPTAPSEAQPPAVTAEATEPAEPAATETAAPAEKATATADPLAVCGDFFGSLSGDVADSAAAEVPDLLINMPSQLDTTTVMPYTSMNELLAGLVLRSPNKTLLSAEVSELDGFVPSQQCMQFIGDVLGQFEGAVGQVRVQSQVDRRALAAGSCSDHRFEPSGAW